MTSSGQVNQDDSDWRQFLLKPSFAERVWGRTSLAPFYGETGLTGPVGEAWLTGPECVVAGGELAGKKLSEAVPGFPLLVKILFPDDKLSVQVHPDDARARQLGLERGKTECWYVLEAEAGSRVACGVTAGTSVEDVRSAVEAGAREDRMQWLDVVPGDMVYVDAGTLHAIGPGMTLLEVQQTCDVTYRLYDYGRPRELHLKEGLAALKLDTRAGKVKAHHRDGYTRLIETEYFIVDLFELPAGQAYEMEMEGTGCIAGIRGKGAVNETRFTAGEAVVIPDGSATLTSADGCTFVRCTVPDSDEAGSGG